jgi:hypothetical protein
MASTITLTDGQAVELPAGAILCPECLGRGIVGRRADNGDPQDEESTDCPRCDPHDGYASTGHVSTVRTWEAKQLRDAGYSAAPAR